jgi:hypothetical protein
LKEKCPDATGLEGWPMAVPAPREGFLAICPGARLCLPMGIEGQSWVLSEVNSGAYRSRVSEYLRIANPALHLTVEF